MEKTNQNKVMIILGAILVAVLLASGGIVYVISIQGGASSEVTDNTNINNSIGGNTNVGFDTTPLKRSEYTSLNGQLIQSGQLPVQPPAVKGKANPFL